jgi:hypothetical protein
MERAILSPFSDKHHATLKEQQREKDRLLTENLNLK